MELQFGSWADGVRPGELDTAMEKRELRQREMFRRRTVKAGVKYIEAAAVADAEERLEETLEKERQLAEVQVSAAEEEAEGLRLQVKRLEEMAVLKAQITDLKIRRLETQVAWLTEPPTKSSEQVAAEILVELGK